MPKFPKGSQEAKDYMASIRAKRGKGVKKCSCEGEGDCSCCSGGSLVGGTPPPPPPPPPPRPSLPPPIDTSFSINQSLINAIEEILMSSSLPEERKTQLMAELKRLKDKVSDAGVAKESTAKPSGAGIIPMFKKPKEKVAPAPDYTDPYEDPEFIALMAESDRIMKEMKMIIEKNKQREERKQMAKSDKKQKN